MSVEESTETDEAEGQVDDTQTEQGEGTETPEEGQESPEVEVVLAGDDGSQPAKNNLGIRKRINKLNAKVNAAEQEASQSTDALAVEKERNRLLQIAVDQARSGGNEAPKPPDTLDYVDGAADPQYAAALQQFNSGLIDAAVQRRMTAQQQSVVSAQDTASDARELEQLQTSHYERAEKLGVKDYEETEDAVIASLGRENVNHIIRATTNSETLLYYLGKNPDKAAYFADLIKTDSVKAVFELGALSDGLVVQPKVNQNPAPDPDTDLEGATPTSRSDYERRLDKARDKALATGDMDSLIAFKRANKEGATT